jgi:pyruvate/2-oxoglutarate dehydrogenase complex dihydrolipoamide dehydrogenase (E3) component
MDKQGVEVHLATEATSDLIVKESPDAVVLATGISPLIPDIDGVEGGNVVLAADVLTGRAKVSDRVAIIGGELVGCEVANFLAEAGKKVTLMRRGTELALKVNRSIREPLLYRLSSKEEVTILTGIQYKEITSDGVVIIDKEGREQTITADTIVLAAGAKPNTELLPILKEKISEVYAVGDCAEPRNILESMKEGYRASLSL